MPKSVYSKILNRYVSDDNPILKKQPYYWNQGIGRTVALPIEDIVVSDCIFDHTFDETFGCTTIVDEGYFDTTFDLTFN